MPYYINKPPANNPCTKDCPDRSSMCRATCKKGYDFWLENRRKNEAIARENTRLYGKTEGANKRRRETQKAAQKKSRGRR